MPRGSFFCYRFSLHFGALWSQAQTASTVSTFYPVLLCKQMINLWDIKPAARDWPQNKTVYLFIRLVSANQNLIWGGLTNPPSLAVSVQHEHDESPMWTCLTLPRRAWKMFASHTSIELHNICCNTDHKGAMYMAWLESWLYLGISLGYGLCMP